MIKTVMLKNAIDYDGRTRLDAVISKILGSRPDLRDNVEAVMYEIKTLLPEINSLTLNEQKTMLEQLLPEETPKKKPHSKCQTCLPPLAGAEMGKVVTRFPPEPNGYPHIGHAKAAIIDEEYAKMYSGKLILRFDDTNPLNEKIEYYTAIKDGLEWLGVKEDLVKNTSDDIDLLHEFGKKLVIIGGAYICTCDRSAIHSRRLRGISCNCRSDPSKSIDRLKSMFDGTFEPNEAIIRFRGNMSDSNTALRDPTLFRIIDSVHPKLGTRVRVFPTYDFASPIEDSLDGVTHAMRSKEYELRNQLYYSILERLSLRKPLITEFGRLDFEGVPVSKRKLKLLVENKTIDGWDDPRLPTLIGLKRRGFLPEAIRKFVVSLGLTLSETKAPFETLESINRKILDKISIRVFFVEDPIEMRIRNAPPTNAVLRNHPTVELGSRNVDVRDSVYVSRTDAEKFTVDQDIRLMELYNIRIEEINVGSVEPIIIARFTDMEVKQDTPKIHWVATNDKISYKVLVPREIYVGDQYNNSSLSIASGYAESYVGKLPADTRIQLVRFGFCRIDGRNQAIFTHR